MDKNSDFHPKELKPEIIKQKREIKIKRKEIIAFGIGLSIVIVIFALFYFIPKKEPTKYLVDTSHPEQKPSRPYTIQVAVFKKERDAKNLSINLISKGYQATFIASSGNSPSYRVYVGEFQDRETAQIFLDKFKKDEGFKDSFIRKRF